MSPTTTEAEVHGIGVPASERSDGPESMIPDPVRPAVSTLRPYAAGRPVHSAGPAAGPEAAR